jgi:formate dehydrogenase
MNQPQWDEGLLNELSRVMTDASICGLGQAAMNPVKQVMKHFRADLTGELKPAPEGQAEPAPGKPARY